MLSIWMPQQFSETKNADPGRIAAQVVSGMGFLGAGAIIRLGRDVKGLTTAASLWLIAAIGMTIGAGMYIAALTAEVLALITLVTLNRMERKIFPDVRNKLLEIHYNHSDEPDTDSVLEIFKKFSIRNNVIDIFPGHRLRKTKVRFAISILDSFDISKLTNALSTHEDIENIEIKEKSSAD
jgi:putative Mg2+ transporter-C (MgtC) family protein